MAGGLSASSLCATALLLAAALGAPGAEAGAVTSQLTVTTTYGPVTGQASVVNASVRAFIGIPYAAPPVGNLRWAPPQPPQSWSTAQPAQYLIDPTGQLPNFGVMCPQSLAGWQIYYLNTSDPAQSYIPSIMSEDCLLLNVWTPCRDASCNLPVIVFMHGGAWVEGSAMLWDYEGTHFAEYGAVFVSVNYRLGALGFMALSVNTVANNTNFGFQDQQLALRWVQANIARFGGDPTRVMVTGESAGSEAVSAHVISPSSQGLFRRGLMESCAVAFTPGPIPDYAKPLSVAQAGAAKFLAQMGCAGDIACARQMGVYDLINQQETLRSGLSGFAPTDDQLAFGAPPYSLSTFGAYPYFSFEIVMDGTFYPQQPVQNLLSGIGVNPAVDLLAGYNLDEGNTFFDESTTLYNLTKMFDAHFPPSTMACQNGGMKAKYSPSKFGGSVRAAAAAAYRDYYMTCPTRTTLQGLYKASSAAPSPNLYLYKYTYSNAYSDGASHGSEMPYLFGNAPYGYTFTQAEATLGNAMRRVWVNFAATGNPGFNWPKWDPVNEVMLIFDVTAFTNNNRTAVFATTPMPKSQCQYMEATPSTPTCVSPPPPSPPSPPSPPPSPALPPASSSPPSPRPPLPSPPPVKVPNVTNAAAAVAAPAMRVGPMVLAAAALVAGLLIY